MERFSRRQLLLAIGVSVGIVLLIALVVFISRPSVTVVEESQAPLAPEVAEPQPSVTYAVIGSSVQGRSIEAFTYGKGSKHIVFVGGIHGGYEWNSVLLAYELIDTLEAETLPVPDDLTVTVIPSLNPDGVFSVIGTEGRFTLEDALNAPVGTAGEGRFNAHEVDLNRNFDCKWKPESTWRGIPVSAGTHPFSEPEAQALRDFVTDKRPEAVVFFHSQSDAVYASECEEGVLPTTRTIMQLYARESGYTPIESFDAYPISGDAEGWLASIDIPAITVELSTHETVEWERNLPAIRSLLTYFATTTSSK